MIKGILSQIKFKFSKFYFNGNKINDQINESFGKPKGDDFDFDSIETYFRNKDNSAAYQVLSDKTCADLDFEELFMFLDRTNSKVGQQYLYNKLRTIQDDKREVTLNEELITEFYVNSELRVATQKKLQALNHRDAYHLISLFQKEHPEPPKFFFLLKLLSFASVASLILSFFNPLVFIVLIGLFCINFVLHYLNKIHLVPYVTSIPQLLKLNQLASDLYKNPIFKKIDPKLSSSIKVINSIKSSMSFLQFERKLQGEIEILFWIVFELVKTIFLLEPLVLFGALKKLNSKREEIENVFEFVGQVDMLISISSLRAGLKTYCIPIIDDTEKIVAEDLTHPLIYNCAANNIKIHEKSVFLTGSNMSGKTSFIRAIGLNIITGLTINTCFAKSMSFPLMNIFSAIRISDDLMSDKSYYFEEVLTIKDMLKESSNSKRNLFLLDEIFKGTNTIERISAGKAVLSALAKNENKVIVSTHDIELTDMLSNDYALYHFSETINNNTVDFDYKLKEGKLKNRNAIRILEINDYPKEVIREAIEISEILDQQLLKK